MPEVKLLAVDPGAKRLGLAVGSAVGGVVTPMGVLAHTGIEDVAERIVALARERGVDVVVVGLPTDRDGGETPACRRSHRLAAELRAHGLEVVMQAEWLSTDEARRRGREAGRRRDEPVDDLAAMVILEEHLAERERSG